MYPHSAVTAPLCYRGGRLHAAAQPRCADTVGVRIRGRRIGTILYPSTASTNKSVSEFRGNTIEVTEVRERGERHGGRSCARHALLHACPDAVAFSTICYFSVDQVIEFVLCLTDVDSVLRAQQQQQQLQLQRQLSSWPFDVVFGAQSGCMQQSYRV